MELQNHLQLQRIGDHKYIVRIFCFNTSYVSWNFLLEILRIVFPMKFVTSIRKQICSCRSFCLKNNAGWGKETVVPLYSSAFISTGVKLSSSFLLKLHCTRQGAGIDFIATVIHWPPFFSSSVFSLITLGISKKHCIVRLRI